MLYRTAQEHRTRVFYTHQMWKSANNPAQIGTMGTPDTLIRFQQRNSPGILICIQWRICHRDG